MRFLLGALAGLTRLAGLVIGAAAAITLIWAPRNRSRLIAGMLGGGAGFAGWAAYVAVLSQDPLGVFHAASTWIQSSPAEHLDFLLKHDGHRFVVWGGFLGIVLIGSLLMLRRDRELGLFALGVTAVAILGTIAVPSGSIARYALPAFPAYAGVAASIGRRPTIALVVLFALGQVVFFAWTLGPGAIAP